MPDKLRAYWELMRFDRPIGTYLLLWPTLIALWLAAGEFPPLYLLVVFVCGTYVMRAAGCVINDIADRKFDPLVARTKNRPLADGRITVLEAFVCFGILCMIGLGIVLTLNTATKLLAVAGIALAVVYPFLKRVTQLPQVGLAIVFGWGILLASTAIHRHIILVVGLWFLANALWIVAYDTQYAMVDRDDDLKLGLKSTAILLGRFDRLAIMILQILTVGLLITIGLIVNFGVLYAVAVTAVIGLFLYQWFLVRNREREQCFKAFLNNAWVGFILFAGVALDSIDYSQLI